MALATMPNIGKKDKITCIQLSKETRNRLAEMGGKNDTYEDIVKALIDFKTPVIESNQIKDVVTRGHED